MATKIQCPNPQHEDSTPSFAVYPNGGYCFGCGYRLSREEMVAQGIDTIPPRSGAAKQSENRPSLADLRWYSHALTVGPFRDRIDFFYRRGFSHRTIEDNLFGHTGENFVIPLWNERELVGVQYRRDDEFAPYKPKYRTPRGQPVQTFSQGLPSKQVLVAEGPLDAALLVQYGYSVIGTSGGAGAIPKAVRDAIRNPRAVRLYVCTDMDQAGDEVVEKLSERFPNVYRVMWPMGKDITEALSCLEPLDRGTTLQKWIHESDQSNKRTEEHATMGLSI